MLVAFHFIQKHRNVKISITSVDINKFFSKKLFSSNDAVRFL